MNRIAALQVSIAGTLRDALGTLDRGGLRVALVTDERGRLVGILTDGDVRRALLGGAPLETKLEPFMRRSFVSVHRAAGRAEVLDLMQARRIDVIPIIDDGGNLQGCHQLHDVLGVHDRPNWAVIMAGGRGSRLGPLTRDQPKPMIRVAGRPILERLVLHLVGFGIKRIFLSINYLGHVIEAHFGTGEAFGCHITYLREEQALGTAGALALLPEGLRDPLVVINGDLVTQVNVGGMLDSHTASKSMLTLGVRRYFHTVPFGCVEVSGARITGIEEKPTLSRLINAGIYVLQPELAGQVPRNTEFGMPSLVADCLARGEAVTAFEVADDWTDVGHHEQLMQARGESK